MGRRLARLPSLQHRPLPPCTYLCPDRSPAVLAADRPDLPCHLSRAGNYLKLHGEMRQLGTPSAPPSGRTTSRKSGGGGGSGGDTGGGGAVSMQT